MKSPSCFCYLLLCFAVACSSSVRRPGVLPSAASSATLGPGDRFELIVVGEDKFPKEYTVAPDGTVDFPWVQRQQVVGMEPQELASHVKQLLVQQGYLSDPSVIVSVKEFNSKHVTVGGQVAKPGDVAYAPGLSLLRLISSAGGLTSSANRDNVLVTRKVANGHTKTVSFSVADISEGRMPDVPLQAGDSVYVYERPF